jgi:hypothetical protein
MRCAALAPTAALRRLRYAGSRIPLSAGACGAYTSARSIAASCRDDGRGYRRFLPTVIVGREAFANVAEECLRHQNDIDQ